MTRILPLLLLLLFAGCKSTRLVRILYAGEMEGPSEFYYEFPFEERSGLIVLDVEIQGEIQQLVFDTGTPNVITTALAEKLGLESVFSNKVSDSQSQVQKLSFTTIPEITLGEVHFNNFGAVLVDWEHVPQLECLEIDGLLGANLMRKVCWQVDYDQMVVRMANDCAAFSFSADTLSIPFTTSAQGSPFVDLTFGEKPLNTVLVDLGANGALTISPGFYEQLRSTYFLPDPLTGSGFGSAGIYGQLQDTIRQAVIPELQMGGYPIEHRIARVTGDNEAVLGNRFFLPWRTTFDWSSNRIILDPGVQAPENVYYTHGLALGFADGKVQVDFVWHNSQADRLGIQVGQQVLRLEEYNFRSDPFGSFCSFFRDRSNLLDRDQIELEVLTDSGVEVLRLDRIQYKE